MKLLPLFLILSLSACSGPKLESNKTLHCQPLRTGFSNIALGSVTLNEDGDRITVQLKNISKKDIEYTATMATATSTGGDTQSFFYISSGGISVPATEIPGYLLISPNENHLLSFQKMTARKL
jgi:hypothetical protein